MAYDSLFNTLNEKQQIVLQIFKDNSVPLTNEEVKDLIGWEINRVTPRVKELTDAGFLKVIGRKMTKSNRQAEARALANYQMQTMNF